MNSMITLRFFNGMESAKVDDTEISSWQPVGSWLIEILNADFADIAHRLDECKKPISDNPQIIAPFSSLGLAMWDEDKAIAARNTLLADYPGIFSFFSVADFWVAWRDITFEFCGTNHQGDLMTVLDVASFRTFIDELQQSSEFFTFAFIDYLNTIGIIPPFPAIPCSVHGDHHKAGERCLEDVSLKELYKIFSSGSSQQGKEYRYEFPDVARIGMIMVCSLLEIARQGKAIRKCQNCGKYFIPAKRSDTLYCDNPSPNAPEMTCKEYGTRRLWYERQKEDELATLSRKIASAKGMLAKRNPDIPAYAASYEYFKAERMIWKKAVDEGRKTKEEYRKWLLLMQSQKVIKEAISSNNSE